MDTQKLMTRISAAGNFLIDMDATDWRLVQYDEDGNETTILRVTLGEPLQYTGDFAASHHLPSGGILPGDYIRQVVVGWSYEDEAWHLGLLLARDLADARGSRWCEIAWWPDPDLAVFGDIAQSAGQKLAQVLAKPLNSVSPRPQEKAQEPPLPELPLEIGVWRLEQLEEKKLVLIRKRKWALARVARFSWYLFWAVIYFLLSFATLNSDLALPNAGTLLPSPKLLPYLGLAVGGVLILMAFYHVYELLKSANRIIVDGQDHCVLGLRGSSKRWEQTGNNLCDIYVTHVVKQKRKKYVAYYSELNLHLTDGGFFCIIKQPSKEKNVGRTPAEKTKETSQNESEENESLAELTAWSKLNPLQAIGLHIAKTLGDMPCWDDLRVR